MRRKDLIYFLKTIELKINAWRFEELKKKSRYLEIRANSALELQEKWNEMDLEYHQFQPYFNPYFYFKNTDFFKNTYAFEEEVPIRLKSAKYNNPLIAFYYGLVSWNAGNSKDQLLKIANYTLEKGNIKNDSITFPYDFDYVLFGLKKPWISGITQSLAVSFYCRIFTLSKEVRFLEAAKNSFLPMTVSVDMGGLLCSTNDGLEWVEEYPSKPDSYVLNGHIFSIISAIEMYQLTGEIFFKLHADQWIKSLIHHLPDYQYKAFILHNKRQNKLSNIEYQGLYIGLFKHLYAITQHGLFRELELFYEDQISWSDFYKFYGIKN